MSANPIYDKFAKLNDKASVDLPAVNTPLGTALGLLAPLAGANTWTNTQTFDSLASIPGGAELTVGGGVFMEGGSTFAYETNTERAAHRAELGVFGAGDAATFASVTATGIISGASESIFGDVTIDGGSSTSGIRYSSGRLFLCSGANILDMTTTRTILSSGSLQVADPTEATAIGAASVRVIGGLSVAKSAIIGGNLTTSGTLTTGVYTVATLPTPSAGMRAYVSDANATTYLSTVAAGGANVVPVFYNGTNWVIA